MLEGGKMSDTSLTGYRLAIHSVRTVHPFLDGTVPDMVSDRVSRLYLDSLRCFLSSKPFVDSLLIHRLIECSESDVERSANSEVVRSFFYHELLENSS